MEKSNFHPKIIKLSENYSYAIAGGLLNRIATKKEMEWIQANLIFFLKATERLDRINNDGEEIIDV